MSQLQTDLCLPRRAMGYLSGPMSAPTALTRQLHHLRAMEVSHKLWEQGILHYCPHANSPQIGTTDLDYESWVQMDLEVLRRCDWILMIGDWATSSGCRREFNVAEALQLPIAYTIDEAVGYAAAVESGLHGGQWLAEASL